MLQYSISEWVGGKARLRNELVSKPSSLFNGRELSENAVTATFLHPSVVILERGSHLSTRVGWD